MATEPARSWRTQLLQSLRIVLRLERLQKVEADEQKSILRLHLHQHQLLVEMFRASLAGLVALGLTSLGFMLYAIQLLDLPTWLVLCLLLACLVLVLGLWRTWREFCLYRQHYQEVYHMLHQQLTEQSRRTQKTMQGRRPVERLLLALKPAPHHGWDAKDCQHCGQSMELLSKVCLHCNKKQSKTLTN